MMRDFLETLGKALQRGRNLALVTVVVRSGSAPRGPGAQMLVDAAGRFWGTVGGGRIEREAELFALECLQTGKSALREYCLDAEGAKSVGMVCGGDVQLATFFLPCGDRALSSLVENALALLRTGGDGWLLRPLSQAVPGPLFLLTQAEAAAQFPALCGVSGQQLLFTQDGAPFFAQRLSRHGRVYLFGGGHVARQLAPLLARLDFRFTVLDDRPEFSLSADFPGAEQVLCVDFAHLLQEIAPAPADYAAVMTHGHLFDLEVQKQLLATPIGFIGVMGSRKKKAFVFDALRKAGFTDADLARIVTPIGLPLGGETPAEIALSIAAQLVQLRSQRER